MSGIKEQLNKDAIKISSYSIHNKHLLALQMSCLQFRLSSVLSWPSVLLYTFMPLSGVCILYFAAVLMMLATRVSGICLTAPLQTVPLALSSWSNHESPKTKTQRCEQPHQAVCSEGVEVWKGSDTETYLLLRCSVEILGWFFLVTLTPAQL